MIYYKIFVNIMCVVDVSCEAVHCNYLTSANLTRGVTMTACMRNDACCESLNDLVNRSHVPSSGFRKNIVFLSLLIVYFSAMKTILKQKRRRPRKRIMRRQRWNKRRRNSRVQCRFRSRYICNNFAVTCFFLAITRYFFGVSSNEHRELFSHIPMHRCPLKLFWLIIL